MGEDEPLVVVARAPERLGPFELIKRIGTGGFCETYLARQHGPEGFVKDVCLKRVLPERAGDPEYIAPMRDEAVLQAALSHPNIVKVYDFRKIDGQHVIVMDYVDGASLSELVRFCRARREAFPRPLALHVMHKVLSALSASHRLVRQGEEQQLIHRDINPKNILIDRGGHVLLIDFGLVKAKHRVYRTQSGFVRGTLPYTAPETIMAGVPGRPLVEDARTDVYAAGVTLYELLADCHPYARPGFVELQIAPAIVKGEHPPLATVAGDLPDGLAAVVEQLMACKMDERPANALAACFLLAPYLPRDFDAELALSELVVRSLGNRPSLATGYSLPAESRPERESSSGVQAREGDPAPAPVAPREQRADTPTAPLPGLAPEASFATAVAAAPPVTAPLRDDDSRMRRRRRLVRSVLVSVATGGLLAGALSTLIRLPSDPRSSAGPSASPAKAPAPPAAPETPLEAPGARAPSMESTPVVMPAATHEPADDAATAAGDAPPEVLHEPESSPSRQTAERAAQRQGSQVGSQGGASRSTLKTAKLEVAVSGTEPWEVWVDDVYMGQTPATVAVAPGRHEVAVGKEQPSLRKWIRISGQQTKNIRFPSPAP